MKKLISLTLALMLALSCMSITAFAAATAFEKDFLLNIPHVTVGMTAQQLKEGITFADTTIGDDITLIDAIFYNSAQSSKGTVAAPEHDQIFITFQLKNTTDYSNFGGKTLKALPFKSYNAEVTFKDGTTALSNVGTIIGNSFDTTTHEVGNSGEGDNTYCQVRCSVTVYDGTAILDLDGSDTPYPDTKTIDQLYTASVTVNNTGKTKVQVSWTLENIAVSVAHNKVWNTETLQWDADTGKTDTSEASDVTASFDFVNFSSVKIDAKVAFAVASGFSTVTPAFTDDGVASGDGVITLGTKADGASADNDGNITVAVSPKDSDFKDLTQNKTNATYGTYTVTIDRVSYAISATMTNAKAATTNPTKIKEDGTATLVYTADATYALPDSVTVTGAILVSWDKATGTLVIKNPTGAVTVSGAAVSTGFTVTPNLTNVTADSGNPTVASQSGTTTLVFNAESGYLLPTDIKYTDVISVSGATVESWTLSNNGTTGTLVISNPTTAVSVTLVGGNKPTITTQPVSVQDYPSGASISPTFTVAVNDTNCAYQWYSSEPHTGSGPYTGEPGEFSLIDGATNASYTAGITLQETIFFKCVVTNPYGSVESNVVFGYCID